MAIAPRLRVRATLIAAALAVLGPLAQPAEAATTFTFRGRGWGHGVGMSQWGARGLAERGWSAERILRHYYRGTRIESLSTPSGIRVGLLQERNEIKLTGNGRFDLHDRNGRLRASGRKDQVWRIKPDGPDHLDVYDHQGALKFSSAVPVTVRYEQYGTLLKLPATGYEYKRGRIDLDVNRSTGKSRAILLIAFEQYLYGLAEMPSSWHSSALSVQAIAARSYALEKVLTLGQNRSVCNCAVYASTADQAYAGVRPEVSRWTAAVDRTKGLVMTYQGKPIKAFYSSSSGGFTENNEYVWGGKALPYLRGVCDPGDSVGGANPHSNWTVTLDGAELDRRVREAGHVIGEVQKVEVRKPRGASGRITPVLDQDRGGVRFRGSLGNVILSGASFRSLIGAKSTLVHHHIKGAIRGRWEALLCRPGLPTRGEFTWRDLDGRARGSAQNFTDGRLFRNASGNVVFWTRGAILERYDDLRAKGVDLRLPISDEYAISGGRRSDFERGYITWNSSSGKTSVHMNR